MNAGEGTLAPTAFRKLPLGSIQADGWLRSQLELQRAGLAGHLDPHWLHDDWWVGKDGKNGACLPSKPHVACGPCYSPTGVMILPCPVWMPHHRRSSPKPQAIRWNWNWCRTDARDCVSRNSPCCGIRKAGSRNGAPRQESIPHGERYDSLNPSRPPLQCGYTWCR